jgi:hypothetical protein
MRTKDNAYAEKKRVYYQLFLLEVFIVGEKGGNYFSSYVSPNIFPFPPKTQPPYSTIDEHKRKVKPCSISAIHLYKDLFLDYD